MIAQQRSFFNSFLAHNKSGPPGPGATHFFRAKHAEDAGRLLTIARKGCYRDCFKACWARLETSDWGWT